MKCEKVIVMMSCPVSIYANVRSAKLQSPNPRTPSGCRGWAVPGRSHSTALYRHWAVVCGDNWVHRCVNSINVYVDKQPMALFDRALQCLLLYVVPVGDEHMWCSISSDERSDVYVHSLGRV